MKIYLLMTLFGILFTAIHFTSTPKQGSKQVLNKPKSQPRQPTQGIAIGNSALPARIDWMSGVVRPV